MPRSGTPWPSPNGWAHAPSCSFTMDRNRHDDALDRITDGLTTDIPVVVARDGQVLDVPAR
jgi:hypothetical protein